MARALNRETTELENCVLGVVWLRGPCTAYVVRQEFVASQSSHWSGSGGAIYPLLQRLENAGLIAAVQAVWGSGKKKTYRVTKRGEETLRRWIGPPLPEWTAAPTFDPVRTRIAFLRAIPPARRRAFVSAALENLQKEIDVAQALLAEPRELFDRLGILGVLYELEGRRKWLQSVKKQLSTRVR